MGSVSASLLMASRSDRIRNRRRSTTMPRYCLARYGSPFLSLRAFDRCLLAATRRSNGPEFIQARSSARAERRRDATRRDAMRGRSSDASSRRTFARAAGGFAFSKLRAGICRAIYQTGRPLGNASSNVSFDCSLSKLLFRSMISDVRFEDQRSSADFVISRDRALSRASSIADIDPRVSNSAIALIHAGSSDGNKARVRRVRVLPSSCLEPIKSAKRYAHPIRRGKCGARASETLDLKVESLLTRRAASTRVPGSLGTRSKKGLPVPS